MTHHERIKILKELKEWPVSTITEKLKQIEESLNWAIKICEKHASKKEAKKND
jgi:hypothetical protein